MTLPSVLPSSIRCVYHAEFILDLADLVYLSSVLTLILINKSEIKVP